MVTSEITEEFHTRFTQNQAIFRGFRQGKLFDFGQNLSKIFSDLTSVSFDKLLISWVTSYAYVPVNLTHVKLRTLGNLTQNEARPVGHLTVMLKLLAAVGNKRISQSCLLADK